MKQAMAAARRLVEHYPVNDTHGAPPPRPRTPAELVAYVNWALPRARLLGCRVTKPEARAIGFFHAAFEFRQEAAASLEAQRQEALKQENGAGSATREP